MKVKVSFEMNDGTDITVEEETPSNLGNPRFVEKEFDKALTKAVRKMSRAITGIYGEQTSV